MKDHVLLIAGQQPNDFLKRSVTREYLQARILQSLQEHGAFTNWVFVGGTALRFLFGLPRYSEDLDFSLVSAGMDARFPTLMRGVRADLEREAYSVHVKVRERKTVAAAFVKVHGLLKALGLSPHQDEALSVRVEIDTRPPRGAGTDTTVIRRFVTLHLLHHDRPSLFAGKLHAVLTRPYTKGRDLYDLVWYLADRSWPEPNIDLLNHALQQTGWEQQPLTAASWRETVLKALERTDWARAIEDVAPFLEREEDASLLTAETLRKLLGAEGKTTGGTPTRTS